MFVGTVLSHPLINTESESWWAQERSSVHCLIYNSSLACTYCVVCQSPLCQMLLFL